MKKSGQSLRNYRNTTSQLNICVLRVWDETEEEGERLPEEILAKTITNLGKTQIYESKGLCEVDDSPKLRETSHKNIRNNLPKGKHGILKVAIEKKLSPHTEGSL